MFTVFEMFVSTQIQMLESQFPKWWRWEVEPLVVSEGGAPMSAAL